MCDKVSPYENRDERKSQDAEFYADASLVTKKSFFRFVKGYPREDYRPPWPKPHRCVYPRANSSYAFHEDVDPFHRFAAKCESRKYGNVQPHFEPPEEPYTIRDPYSETEARTKYLGTEPTCFVILGKPGLNTAKLATMIVDSWNCVLISPESLIKQEIDQGTEKGRIIVDILKRGECLGPEIIMNLIETRLNKRDVFHRGYVVEGLPLIPNEILDYSSYPSYSGEQANVQTLDEDLMKFFGSSVHRMCGTMDERDVDRKSFSCVTRKSAISSDQRYKSKTCTVESAYERFIFSQVDDIFATWPIRPSIIIYAMCPDADVVRRREHFRFDPTTGQTVDTGLTGMSGNIELLFSHNRAENDVNVSFDLYQELMNEERILDERQRKYLLRRACDKKSNILAQCKLYKRFATPAIEKWVLLHNPQNVIRVDGRTRVLQMFQIVVARFRLLPVPRVILARSYSADGTVKFAGESPGMPLSFDEFEGKSNEEAFQVLRHRETVSPLYPWSLSSWNFLCPVELAKGTTVEGVAKHAVRFMNKIFFLSSSKAADLFIENPRTFLFPFFPRPTCKIAVFGPTYAGKSDLCKTLAQTFGGTIINVKQIEKSLMDVDWDTSYDSLIRLTPGERAEVIANKIQALPKEKIDVEVWRDACYVVDGMYPDADSWKTIVEDSKIVFEDAVLLFDEPPYEYLLSKWRAVHETENEPRGEFEEEYIERMDNLDTEEDETSGVAEYLEHIRQFESNWEAIKEKVAESCKNLITCNVSETNDVSKYVVERIKDRYMDRARIMTDAEKERERDLEEYITMTDGTENMEDEEEDEGRTSEARVKEDTRRLGDSSHYCPVALLRYNVFWKGKEEFSSIFMDKIYLLSSAEALEEFILGPQKFFLPLRKPLPTIPPFRVSIIGPLGCGKTALALAISREYGLTHIDYFHRFAMFTKRRGMPRVSRRDVIVAPEDLLEEIELPDELDDERYNSHAATVQTFIRRYWNTGAVLPKRMLWECLLTFFEGLYNHHGIVFDQFPSCPQDVEAALKNYTVPEMIIELRCSRDVAFQRIVPELLESWKSKLEEKKRIENLRHAEELGEYEDEREIWILKMLRESFQERFMGEEHEDTPGYVSKESSWHGMMEYEDEEFSGYPRFEDYVHSEEGELRRFELQEAWLQDHPEPVPFTDWEDFETARQRIVQGFEESYERDFQKLDATRSSLENESIAYVTVNAERSFEKVLLEVMRILYPHAVRDTSVLERMYTVDLETAETLLQCGYYFQSSFGRWCPVQLRENKNPLHMFLPLEAEQEIHPVIHRQYVYFLGGKEARSLFLKNPFKYLEQDSRAPIVPFRLSIIGPPKCGKTTLARRFAKQYGVKIVTRGAALRYMLKHFGWTESARSMEARLREGQLVPEESLSRAVEMYSIDPASNSQGFVLDGFPSSRREFEQLTLLGLQPMLVLDLKANLAFCLECLSSEAGKIEKPVNFSKRFLARRYANWEIDRDSFRDWLGQFTRNVIEIDATKSMWHAWTRADREVRSRYINIRTYFRESDYDKVHSLKLMSVSPYEFKTRQSRFESYCPLCLLYENATKTSGPPPNHRGIVQFREHFYWVCSRHMDEFVENPEKYLPPINTALPPEERPRVLTETVDKEHPCWARRLKVGGFCLVTYVDNLPNRTLVPGKPNIGVLYRDNVYLFCSEECREMFMTRFEMYAKADVKFLGTLSPIDIRALPDLGFLEQTVAKLIVRAVNEVGVIRPKIPGLSAAITAAIYIGVYLKTRNVSCALKETEIYETVDKRIHGRDRIIQVATRTIKKKLNPFLTVPVYKDDGHRRSRLSEEISVLSEMFPRPSHFIKFRRTSPTQIFYDPDENVDHSRRVPVPDTRFDYLCEYFKPASKVPAFLNVVDIAGLVKGAAEGQGLGNSFLSHINACDGIFHLCRAFDDDDVTHVEGDVDPVRDLEIISEELRLKDIEFLNGHLEKLEKLVVRGNDKKLKPEYDTLLKVKGVMVDEKRHIRFADWSATDIEVLNKYLFLTSKPVIYLVNLSEKDYIRKKNKWLIKIKEWVDKNDPGAILIPFSGYFENKLVDMEEPERAKYFEDNKVTSALDKIIVQGYKALQLQYFFTAGHDEVKAWTIQKGTKAPQAAGKIHTDFEKGFIMAEVMKFDDFKNEGSEASVKAAGKYRQQGRNYVVEDGDIIFFKFNAGAGLKDAKKK